MRRLVLALSVLTVWLLLTTFSSVSAASSALLRGNTDEQHVLAVSGPRTLDAFAASGSGATRAGSILLNADGTLHAVPNVDAANGIVYGTYEDTHMSKGWGVLRVQMTTRTDVADGVKAYALGLLEAFLTSDLMWDYTYNYFMNEFGGMTINAPPAFFQYFDDQISFVQQNIRTRASQPTAQLQRYWQAQYLIDQQFHGLVDGYTSYHSSPAQALSAFQLYIMQSAGDLYELRDKYNVTRSETHHLHGPEKPHECSAIVQFCPGQDLYAAHITWRAWYAMGIRIYKYVTYQWASLPSSPFTVATSGSPTFISSKDDFFSIQALNGVRLTVMETTNSVFNRTLLDAIKPQSTLCWQRAVASNFIARDGDTWTATFSLFNSGTYNNQWMVVSNHLYTKQLKQLPAGSLWIMEQMPGLVRRGDVTSFVNQHGYWGSYNVPYFTDIYDAAGYPAIFKKAGDEYSYENCSRARIFRRWADNYQNCAADTSKVKQIIRYNDFQHDPISGGDPFKAIASRGDMVPPTQGHKTAFGGIDGKISAATRVDFTAVDAIVGPTDDQLPPFVWSQVPEFAKVVHIGTPDKFAFDWLYIPSAASSSSSSADSE